MFFTRSGLKSPMGISSIVQCSDKKLYWFDGKASTPEDFMSKHNLQLRHEGYISTWACYYHFFQAENNSFDEIQDAVGSRNIWRFSSDEIEHYGVFLQTEGVLRQEIVLLTGEEIWRCDHPGVLF
ncbi:uncharacterized protein BO72DRAFT_105711 [Aspergillus fijiensis CBS 313.89]|uniref:Uncharacterized protein n=1 Tax=Aspergillus fijiensis CBS 313.89 TaxID=1448319 RepID=A0A8G1RQ77_9EURO|nr:uncharacterized protein BO72DRAFT_105711 [Aspergillus fijiensis CBS 313.89]RAK77450.1 hypothetical protein BO72DRAFT_105711 [Aspergillus fijiensis CBS 313.89]